MTIQQYIHTTKSTVDKTSALIVMFVTSRVSSSFRLKQSNFFRPLSKKFLSINDARKQILSHELISKSAKDSKNSGINDTSTLAELYYAVVDPVLSQLPRTEQLELYSFLLKQTSPIEFGISNHILMEMIDIMNKLECKGDITKTSISHMIENNPGRRHSHFDYLGELLKIRAHLNLDFSSTDNKLLLDFLQKLIKTEENLEPEELMENLDKIIYLFINLKAETIEKHMPKDLLDEIYIKLLTTSSSNLLKQFLDKLLTVCKDCSNKAFKLNKETDITTPIQLYLTTKYNFKTAAKCDRSQILTELSNLAKKQGPVAKLSLAENRALASIMAIENSLYKNVDLPNKLDSFEEINFFKDFVALFKSLPDGIANDDQLLANVARFKFILNGETLDIESSNEAIKFEEFYQFCYKIILNPADVSLNTITENSKKYLQELSENKALKLKSIRITMLTYSFIENNEAILDLIIDLFNKNIESFSEKEDAYKLIETFVVCILLKRNLDLANYVKEGFVKNGSLTAPNLKKLNKYFVKYGELTEIESNNKEKNVFSDTMKEMVLDEFIKPL